MFTRRAFGRLLAFAGASAFLRMPRPAVAAIPVLDFAIAGGRYHALPARRASLGPGIVLRLRREPENPFDANAVEVLDGDGLRLGYVPRCVAGEIAARLDAGETLIAEVVGRIGESSSSLEGLAFTDPRSGDPRIRLSRLA